MQHLRMQLLRPQPHSALDCYEPCELFSGWDATDSQPGEDTFKQLCTNLSKYERQYNETKQSNNRSYHFKAINRSWQDKENEVKLPVVIQSTPLKHVKKSPFALKSRNFLQDSIDNDEDSKVKCFRIAKMIKVKKSSLFQQKKPKQPPLVAYKRRKHKKLITNPIIDYDFSDSRILSRHKKQMNVIQGRQ